MKDLLSKEQYYCEIHTLLMKSSAYSPIWTPPRFLPENLDPPTSMTFQKFQCPL